MTRALLLLVLAAGALAAGEPAVLPRAHAHNDYAHPRPLLDALDHGFASVEADVWLVDGALLVAHDRRDLRPGRTLAFLYLEPLHRRWRERGGRVHADGTPITLLIDVKSAAAPTYAAIHRELARFEEMLTRFSAAGVRPGAVTAIISGLRDEAALRAQPVRHAALDGRRAQLDGDEPAALYPWVSENWRTLTPWVWTGPMPEEVRADLRDWVARAHARGRKLRFWNVPDRPDAWAALLDAGVDLLGADDLPGLRAFLLARGDTSGNRPASSP